MQGKGKNSNKNHSEQKATINTDFLIGSWIDQSEALLHFILFADGSAKSDNMATLLYQKWQYKE